MVPGLAWVPGSLLLCACWAWGSAWALGQQGIFPGAGGVNGGLGHFSPPPSFGAGKCSHLSCTSEGTGWVHMEVGRALPTCRRGALGRLPTEISPTVALSSYFSCQWEVRCKSDKFCISQSLFSFQRTYKNAKIECGYLGLFI